MNLYSNWITESHSNLHHHWNCLQHLRSGRMLRHSMAACSVANTLANILWGWNSCSHRHASMVHHWLLGWRKGLWNYIIVFGIHHNDYLDFGMDCSGRSIRKTKSIDRKKSSWFSEALRFALITKFTTWKWLEKEIVLFFTVDIRVSF